MMMWQRCCRRRKKAGESLFRENLIVFWNATKPLKLMNVVRQATIKAVRSNRPKIEPKLRSPIFFFFSGGVSDFRARSLLRNEIKRYKTIRQQWRKKVLIQLLSHTLIRTHSFAHTHSHTLIHTHSNTHSQTHACTHSHTREGPFTL